MPTRRELADAEDFVRHQLAAALLRGDGLDLDEVPRRPNRFLYGGLALLVFALAIAGVRGILSGRPPDGWNNDGRIVLDQETGGRFLSINGTLHPLANTASARLYSGSGQPVVVGHAHIAEAPSGPLAGILGAPDVLPPAASQPPGGWTACVTGRGELAVLAGAPGLAQPPLADVDGALVRTDSDPAIFLVGGQRVHRIQDPDVLPALGYSAAAVRVVPSRWLSLVPTGTDLRVLRLPAPRGKLPADPLRQVDRLVVDAETGRRYVVARGGLRPVANRLSELLLAPGAPAVPVPHGKVLAAAELRPFGYVDAPAEPPQVPARDADAYPCVRSSDGRIAIAARVDTGSLVPQPRSSTAAGPAVTVWLPRDSAAVFRLVGPEVQIDEKAPAYLLVAGLAYPVTGSDALSSLGYSPEQSVRMSRQWLALLPQGPALRSLRGTALAG